MVPEDTVPTNVYTSNYLRHRTVKYGEISAGTLPVTPAEDLQQQSHVDVGDE